MTLKGFFILKIQILKIQLIENVDYRNKAGNKNSSYIKNNRGAVIQIMDYIRI